MSINGRKILKELKAGEAPRGTVSLFLDKTLWRAFQLACGDVSPSKALEKLMREFLNSLDEPVPGSIPAKRNSIIDAVGEMTDDQIDVVDDFIKRTLARQKAGKKD